MKKVGITLWYVIVTIGATIEIVRSFIELFVWLAK